MMDAGSVARCQRSKVRAIAKRELCAAHVKALYKLAEEADTNPEAAPRLVAAGPKLDVLWTGFQEEDDTLLEVLCELNLLTEYSPDFSVEISGMIDYVKSIIARYEEKKAATQSSPKLRDPTVPGEFRRLPEIPLPSFDGDIHQWPAFRDRFAALVAQRDNLSNIEKFYYLVGCLQGIAADVVRGIPVSGPTYEVAWSALVTRFDKPRLVASALVERLLKIPASSTESLTDLHQFLTSFSEGVSVLKSLQIPDLGNFILFSLAVRCLPTVSRTLFEAQLKNAFPTIEELLSFVKSRVTVLERVQGAPCVSSVSMSRSNERVSASPKWPHKPPHTSLVSAPPPATSTVCKYCKNPHTLDVCRKFGALTVDERTKWARAQRMCFSCFSDGHWANRCNVPAKCSVCSRPHHTLLHPTTSDFVASSDPTLPATSASLLSGYGSPSVLLGTALVHVRDRTGGFQPACALVDSASQISAITVACAKRLGLRWSR